jgi:hypothetical protein
MENGEVIEQGNHTDLLAKRVNIMIYVSRVWFSMLLATLTIIIDKQFGIFK